MVIKDFYEYLGEENIQGSKDAFQLAFKRGLIINGKALMESVKSKNEATHTYNEKIAIKVTKDIVAKYYDAFLELKVSLEKEQKTETCNKNVRTR